LRLGLPFFGTPDTILILRAETSWQSKRKGSDYAMYDNNETLFRSNVLFEHDYIQDVDGKYFWNNTIMHTHRMLFACTCIITINNHQKSFLRCWFFMIFKKIQGQMIRFDSLNECLKRDAREDLIELSEMESMITEKKTVIIINVLSWTTVIISVILNSISGSSTGSTLASLLGQKTLLDSGHLGALIWKSESKSGENRPLLFQDQTN